EQVGEYEVVPTRGRGDVPVGRIRPVRARRRRTRPTVGRHRRGRTGDDGQRARRQEGATRRSDQPPDPLPPAHPCHIAAFRVRPTTVRASTAGTVAPSLAYFGTRRPFRVAIRPG